ncbi:hypothetical protein G5S35_30640 [Paraburkholderia tropica]|nr:hypothetical protein G5S35_30640 [Paraburkholderia tropica]
MNTMPLTVSWLDFAGRLALAMVPGTLIGLNRGESGNAAGLRTTLLVCMAACLAMVQVNLLLLQQGKPHDFFVVLDLMRLPLGILSGVGFIVAGSILRKDGLVQGVTTAATMWYVTVIGLCAGGGQYRPMHPHTYIPVDLTCRWGRRGSLQRDARDGLALATTCGRR